VKEIRVPIFVSISLDSSNPEPLFKLAEYQNLLKERRKNEKGFLFIFKFASFDRRQGRRGI
jgi:hypothetical protein